MNIHNTFYEEITIIQGLSCKSLCSLRILYNSKFILINAVVITRVNCTCILVLTACIYFLVHYIFQVVFFGHMCLVSFFNVLILMFPGATIINCLNKSYEIISIPKQKYKINVKKRLPLEARNTLRI